MSALQFLNKKSWHTRSIRNNEQVWLKEQEAEKEQARLKELQKQLEEERKLQEIHRLEIESGRLKPEDIRTQRQLNWMYEEGHHNQQEEKEKEDVLLGKKQVDVEKLDDGKEVEQKSILIDADNKMREDPLMQIQKDEMNKLTDMSKRTGFTVEELKQKKKALKYTKEEWEQKLRRKEQRRQAREEKRKTREHRAAKKRERELKYARQFGLVASPDKNNTNEDQMNTTQTDTIQNSDGYGLQMPFNGTKVAVTKEFVPRRTEKYSEHQPESRPSKRRRTRWDCPPSHPSETNEKMTYEQREAKRIEMERDADQLRVERYARFEQQSREQRDEQFREDRARHRIASEDGTTGFEMPTNRLARQALSSADISSRFRH